jgi:hypothetical protein
MLVLETVAKIRRAYFVQRKTIKAICRELRVSRKVVRKVLRSEATEFRYERDEQPLPRIGPWQDELDGMLASNESKPARERLTLIRLFEALRGLGYAGGYDAVRALCAGLAARACSDVSGCLHSAQFRPRRGLSVRLEPRGCADHRDCARRPGEIRLGRRNGPCQPNKETSMLQTNPNERGPFCVPIDTLVRH